MGIASFVMVSGPLFLNCWLHYPVYSWVDEEEYSAVFTDSLSGIATPSQQLLAEKMWLCQTNSMVDVLL